MPFNNNFLNSRRDVLLSDKFLLQALWTYLSNLQELRLAFSRWSMRFYLRRQWMLALRSAYVKRLGKQWMRIRRSFFQDIFSGFKYMHLLGFGRLWASASHTLKSVAASVGARGRGVLHQVIGATYAAGETTRLWYHTLSALIEHGLGDVASPAGRERLLGHLVAHYHQSEADAKQKAGEVIRQAVQVLYFSLSIEERQACLAKHGIMKKDLDLFTGVSSISDIALSVACSYQQTRRLDLHETSDAIRHHVCLKDRLHGELKQNILLAHVLGEGAQKGKVLMPTYKVMRMQLKPIAYQNADKVEASLPRKAPSGSRGVTSTSLNNQRARWALEAPSKPLIIAHPMHIDRPVPSAALRQDAIEHVTVQSPGQKVGMGKKRNAVSLDPGSVVSSKGMQPIIATPLVPERPFSISRVNRQQKGRKRHLRSRPTDAQLPLAGHREQTSLKSRRVSSSYKNTPVRFSPVPREKARENIITQKPTPLKVPLVIQPFASPALFPKPHVGGASVKAEKPRLEKGLAGGKLSRGLDFFSSTTYRDGNKLVTRQISSRGG